MCGYGTSAWREQSYRCAWWGREQECAVQGTRRVRQARWDVPVACPGGTARARLTIGCPTLRPWRPGSGYRRWGPQGSPVTRVCLHSFTPALPRALGACSPSPAPQVALPALPPHASASLEVPVFAECLQDDGTQVPAYSRRTAAWPGGRGTGWRMAAGAAGEERPAAGRQQGPGLAWAPGLTCCRSAESLME